MLLESVLKLCCIFHVQVWLAVYQLLMNEDCQRKYELNSYSKEQILKVNSHILHVYDLIIYLKFTYLVVPT